MLRIGFIDQTMIFIFLIVLVTSCATSGLKTGFSKNNYAGYDFKQIQDDSLLINSSYEQYIDSCFSSNASALAQVLDTTSVSEKSQRGIKISKRRKVIELGDNPILLGKYIKAQQGKLSFILCIHPDGHTVLSRRLDSSLEISSEALNHIQYETLRIKLEPDSTSPCLSCGPFSYFIDPV